MKSITKLILAGPVLSIVSVILFVLLLPSPWALACIPAMSVGFGVTVVSFAGAIADWFKRDGWK